MKRRTLVISGVIAIVLAGGVLAYTQLRPKQAFRPGDPALAVAFTLGALERTPGQQLSGEQIKAILPLLRVLRDTDPNDVEASRALAEQIRNVLTPAQRDALQRMRGEVRARRQAGQSAPPGSLGQGRGLRQFGPPGSRQEVRQRILTRLIERLQTRL